VESKQSLHEGLVRAERAYDDAARAWDLHDADFQLALRNSRMDAALVDRSLWAERYRISEQRAHAHYRVEHLRFLLGLRSSNPRHPDSGGEPPFNSMPLRSSAEVEG